MAAGHHRRPAVARTAPAAARPDAAAAAPAKAEDADTDEDDDPNENGVAAVVNLAPSISGRYPNLGPQLLIDSGVVLIDQVDQDAFMAVNEGDRVRILGDTVYRGDIAVGSGVRQDAGSVAQALEASKEGMASHLAAFSANAAWQQQ